MKKLVCWGLAALTAVVAVSCVRGKRQGRDHEKEVVVNIGQATLKSFDKIAINAACDVSYEQGDSLSVKVVGSRRAVAGLRVVSKGGCLQLSHKGGHRGWLTRMGDGQLRVYVTSPDLIALSLKGTGDFTSEGRIDSDTLTVSVEGEGDVKLADVVCDHFSASLKGVGDVEVGRLESVSAELSLRGTGDVEVNEVNVKNTDILLLGVGDVKVDFDRCDMASVRVLGVGDVELTGQLRTLHKSVKGTGEVKVKGLKTGPAGADAVKAKGPKAKL